MNAFGRSLYFICTYTHTYIYIFTNSLKNQSFITLCLIKLFRDGFVRNPRGYVLYKFNRKCYQLIRMHIYCIEYVNKFERRRENRFKFIKTIFTSVPRSIRREKNAPMSLTKYERPPSKCVSFRTRVNAIVRRSLLLSCKLIQNYAI